MLKTLSGKMNHLMTSVWVDSEDKECEDEDVSDEDDGSVGEDEIDAASS